MLEIKKHTIENLIFVAVIIVFAILMAYINRINTDIFFGIIYFVLLSVGIITLYLFISSINDGSENEKRRDEL